MPNNLSDRRKKERLGVRLGRKQRRLRLVNSRNNLTFRKRTVEQRGEQHTQTLEALYSVSREINSQLDLSLVLRSVTQKTKELLGAEVVFLCLLDDMGRVMNLRATAGPEAAIQETSSTVCNPMVNGVLSGEGAYRCNGRGCQGCCEIVSTRYRTSHLAAPLRTGSKVIGALCVCSSKPDVLKDGAIDVLVKLASVAAIALQNARLYEQAERAATLEERQRIASEMHDGLAQTLSYLQMAVAQAAQQVEAGRGEEATTTLKRIHTALLQAIEDTRYAIASLQEPLPLPESLQEQVCELAQSFSQDGLQVNWSSTIFTPVILPRHEHEQVMRVVREALLNAVHHAQTSQIDLRIDGGDNSMSVIIEDRGIGFDPAAIHSKQGKHFGLNIMRARASRLGGQLSIHSVSGEGTQVKLSWPVIGKYS